jgi:hypothetical protein
MLATERAARATSTPAGFALAEQSAINNSARLRYLERTIGAQDDDAMKAALDQYWQDGVSRLKLKKGGVDPNRWLGRVLSRSRNNLAGAPRGQAYFAKLKEDLDGILALPEKQQMAALHKFRRTGIDDTLNSMAADPQARSQLQKIIAPELIKFKRVLDTRIQNRLESGDWKGLVKGYAGRAKRLAQTRRAKEALTKIEDGMPLSTGDPSAMASRRFLRKELSPDNALDPRFKTPILNVRGRRPLEKTLASLDREALSSAPDVSARSSQTAENIKFLKESGADWSTEEALQAGGMTIPAFMTHPLLGVGTAGQRLIAHKSKQDIAQRLLTLYRDPRAALAALDKMNLPPAQKSQISQASLLASKGASINSAALGAVSLGQPLLAGQ